MLCGLPSMLEPTSLFPEQYFCFRLPPRSRADHRLTHAALFTGNSGLDLSWLDIKVLRVNAEPQVDRLHSVLPHHTSSQSPVDSCCWSWAR
jgi:hypothetical protein